MKYLLAVLFLFLFQISFAYAQEEEIWYVWIDTQIKQKDNTIRIVSEEPIRITCCVKSPKYRRFQKQTVKWIKKNYDLAFDLETPLKNIEDKSFAETVIKEAIEKSGDDESIIIIKYSATCK